MTAALQRIEQLYAGEVGDAYLARHPQPDRRRAPFWRHVQELTQPASVLEVGCGLGGNLTEWRAAYRVGLDVSPAALAALRVHVPEAQGVQASAGALPFPDRAFDLVLTCGLLIHSPEDALPHVLAEVGRVARRWVLLVEYMDSRRRAIPWRGLDDALWADAYGLLFWCACPDFAPAGRSVLTRREGFDDCEAALFQRVSTMAWASAPEPAAQPGRRAA